MESSQTDPKISCDINQNYKWECIPVTCNRSTQEAETEESKVQGYSGLH